VAEALGLGEDELTTIRLGAYLHDVGKIAVPDSILQKAARLTEDEYALMKQHTTIGERLCGTLRSLALVRPIVRHHHEKRDGSGYPDGLRGEEIPLLARILQVADIYDALTTARSYKPAFSHDHAVEIMLEESQRGWRDPELIPLFAEVARDVKVTPPQTWPVDRSMQESLENMRRQLTK